MLVSIASLRQPTFKVLNHRRRAPGQSVVDYVKSEFDARAEYVRQKIVLAATTAREDHNGTACLFFTLPEFFWNVPWSEVGTEDELHQLNSAYLEHVPAYVTALVRDLPVERYGKIVLLAGSCATLIKVGEGDASYYDVINYLLAITNKEYQSDIPLMSMWPKRHVSGIDFGRNIGTADGYWFFNLFGGVVVRVKTVSDVLAEHSYFGGYEALFINSLVIGCPFGINLCLDYAVLADGERDKEVELAGVKVDFLIACGMGLDYNKRHPSSIQFLVRNDGMGEGECEVAKLAAGKIIEVVPSVMVEDNLYLTLLPID